MEFAICDFMILNKYINYKPNKRTGFRYSQKELDLINNNLKNIENKDNNISFKALRNLGHFYKENEDYTRMIKYYELAADKGDSVAMLRLAIYYEHNEGDVDCDKYYKMAIEKNNIDAFYEYGRMFEEKKKISKALDIYAKGADKKNLKCVKKINQLINFVDNKSKYAQYLTDENKIKFKLDTSDLKIISCCICYETQLLGNYFCLCKDPTICIDCIEKIETCSLCRQTLIK